MRPFVVYRAMWVAVMSLCLAGTSGAQQDVEPVAAPLNPAFVEYLQNASEQRYDAETEEGHGLGLVPAPVKLDHLMGQRQVASAVGYPALWDLRTQGKVTSVKDQASCGSCWAFATYGSLESWFLPAETWNFSENNLKNLAGFDYTCCAGGTHFMSTAYLSRWGGPVNESADPYAYSCSSPSGLPVQKHVQDVTFLPERTGPTDNDNIKQAVYTMGGVYTSMYMTGAAFNSTTNAYYYSGSSYGNHAVTIVGWDDNYDRSRFNTMPPGNGAFIAKNSWGMYWGESGYFYVSYYDTAFTKECAVFQGEATGNYSRCYQYDPYGWVGSTGYGSTTAWFANVFTASASESLVAASWYSASIGSSYTLYVYLDPTSGPIGGSPVATKLGTISTAGYHTVQLDSAVALTSGHKFSIVVRLTTPGYYYPIAYQFPYSGYSSGATGVAGRGYISSNGTAWTDITGYYTNSSVCLKAFSTQAGTLSVTPDTGFSSLGDQGGPFSPSSTSYTVSNPGSAAIDWSATHLPSSPWVTVSPTSGTLNAGASTTVTVSINSNANSLTPGIYGDTIAFTNVTNGAGNTTRPVQLNVAGVSPTSMVITPVGNFSSSGPAGGPFSPDRLEYTVANVSDASINFSVTHDTGANWLTCFYTLPAQTSTPITALINSLAVGLAPGVYQDTITFTNLTNGQGNTTRTAQLMVAGANLSVTPSDGLTSTGNAGGPFSPSSKQYTLTNEGTSTISWSASHQPSIYWVTLSNTLGSLVPGGSTTVTVSINSNANALTGGAYSDTVTFTNLTTGLGNTTRPVSLTVYQGVLSVTPADGLSSSGPVGGPFSPSSKQFTLTNTGNASINWTVSHNPSISWVSLSGTSGTLTQGGSTTVTATINSNANSLPGGNYSDTVSFTNTTNGVGNTTRPVGLAVVQGMLSVTPADGLSSSGAVGGPFSPSSKQYTLTNTGSAPINWTASHDPLVNWITLSGTSGTLVAGGSTTVTVSTNSNANTLPQGNYSDTVSFTNTTSGVGNTTRPVSLAVATKQLTSVAVGPTSLACPSPDVKQLHATAYFSDSTSLDITSLGTWTSSRTSVARVNTSGVVTPVASGSANVTCAYGYGGTTRSGTCAVSVNYQTIYYLYMSPSGYTFYNANPTQFQCQARTRSGYLNVTEVCQWTSSAPSVATIDWRGVVTPVSTGSATISARYLYNGAYLRASATVTVAF